MVKAVATREEKAEWPTRAEVARELKVSHSTVRRWQDEGKLRCESIDGVFRFDPTSVEEAKAEKGIARDTEEELRAANELAQVSTQAASRAMSMVLDAAQKLFERYERDAASRAEYIAKLEASNQQQREAFEAAKSEENARELARKQIEHEMAVRDMIAKSIAEVAVPVVAAKVTEYLSKTPPPSPEASKTNGGA